MKTKLKIFLLLLLRCLPLHATDISFQWDPGASTTNYLFYASTNGLSILTNAVVRLNVGTNITCTVQNLAPGIWTFGVTGIANGLETDLSNTLIIQVPPQPPGNFRTVFVDYGPAVVGPFTNVATFFRLRIP